MPRWSPFVLLVACVLVLTGCAGSDDATGDAATAASTDTASATATAPPTAGATAEPEPVVTPDPAHVVDLSYAGGEVAGDTGRVEVPLGTLVRLSITSDVVDEVHVHGFDLYEDLAPGQASQLEFTADRPGVFEVELHDSRRVLTRLQIS